MKSPLALVVAVAAAAMAVSACSAPAPTSPTPVATTQSASAGGVGSATPSTASASGSTSATPGASGSANLSESFCIPTSKFCFYYPSGYKVVKDSTAGTGAELGHVEDDKGNRILYYRFEQQSAMAGAEGQNPPEQVIVRSQPTHANGDMYKQTAVMASDAVAQDKEGFFPYQFITDGEQASKPGMFASGSFGGSACSLGWVQFKPDRMLWFGTVPGGDAKVRHYPTRGEATAQLETQQAQMVARILKSVETN